MPNNIAVSITADVADFTVKRAVLSAEVKAATKDLKDFARTANASGTTDALQAGMLGAANAAATARAQIALLDRQTGVATTHVGNAREAYEGLRIVQAALRGDFADAAREAGYFTTRLIAQEQGAALVRAAMSPLGLAIIGVTAPTVAGAVAALQYEAAQQRMVTAVVGLGAASGQSKDRLEELAKAGNGLKLSIGESQAAVEAFADAGVRDSQVIEQLKGAVADYAALTGQKATEATKQLAEAMRDPAKGAEDLNQKLSFLDATQLEQIRTLVELGDKTRAQEELSGLLRERTDEAAAASGHLQSGLSKVGTAAKDAWDQVGGLTDALGRLLAQAGAFGAGQQLAAETEAAAAPGRRVAQDILQRQAQQKADSGAAAPLYDETPEGKAAKARTELQGDVNKINTGIAADTALYGAHSAAVTRDRAALAEYTRALTTYKSEIEKKTAADALDVRIAEARHAHNQVLVADLTRQKSLISQSGVVESDADAQALAAAPGDVARAKAGGAKKPKDDQVQVWREELQTQLEDEKSYFADSKAEELKFWTDRVTQTKKGSADERAIKTEIYNLDKALAQQSVTDQLKRFDEQLEAAKGNWAKTQEIDAARLAFVKQATNNETVAVADATLKQEADAREHQRQLTEIAREGEETRLAVLKDGAEAARTIAEQDARTQEAVINARAGGNPVAQIQAAEQIAATKMRLLAEQLAAEEDVYRAEDNLRTQALVDALAKDGQDSASYATAIKAKTEADAAYFAKRKELEDQAANQSITDALTIQQKYVAALQPIGQAFTSTFQGMLAGHETFEQGILKGANQILNTWIAHDVEGLEHFLATELSKTLATKVGAEAQVAAKASAAGQTQAITRASGLQEIIVDAKVAAAGAYKALAGIPVIGPELGAVAAGATFAAVLALGSFDRGLDVAPSDFIGQIHAGERIVPAADNSAIIAALRGAGAGGGAAGDVHAHYSPTFQGAAPDAGVLQESQRDFTRRVEKMARRGVFRSVHA